MPPAGVFLVPARKTRKNRLGEALTVKPVGTDMFRYLVPRLQAVLPETPPGPHRYLSTCRFLYEMEVKFPKGFQRGKRRKGWFSNKLVRFPFWPSGESENHTEGSRWLFAYFLANEKVWHPITMTKPLIKM